MNKTVELTYLKYFFEVARLGGFSKASRALGVQQPSVTRGVQKLEEELGLLLFERSGKSVTLTRAGREIQARCERIFEEARAIRTIAESEKNECAGPLKFAVANPISTYLIPRVLEAYTRNHPNVWPQVFVGSANDLMPRIASSELEFGLFFYAPRPLPGLQATVIEPLRFHLVISARHKADERVKARFIGSREIEDPGTTRFPTLEKLRKTVPAARLAISTNDISAHRELVLRGLGVSILPAFMVEDDLKKGRLVDLSPRQAQRFDLKLLTRKHSVLSHQARLFLDELRAERIVAK